ncbi:UvrB/UvrC motif-containing protein [Bacillus sp. AFS041924]|uniref:UvrB/UvrC motif-containing protein n=1 Tax=Bacillus sp. AFS041924 TaxID=2033503 RepID=UPI000BFB8CA7|nr:UvrB/UvrC motif-containing protein [Bacillus sp. AFS041924]PGS54156.1 DNA helicase UvrC [Bacillus sp. AFS041924]
MKDSKGQILYVGKAKNLKKRVQSYFQNSKGHSPKVKKLVTHLKDFDFILTDTEFDAFMLECHLIKEIKPMYNRMMKSPQSFIYLVINLNKKVPSFEVSYEPLENELVFGPFTSRGIVERAITGIKECFKINCGHSTVKNSACLNYSLGTCNGVCLGGLAHEEYNKITYKVIRFLNRTDMDLLEEMEKLMFEASEQFDFEAAAKYRDWIEMVKSLINKEKVIEFTEQNHNIITIEQLENNKFKYFLINRTQILNGELVQIEDGSFDQLIEEMNSNSFEYFKNIDDQSSTDVCRDEIDEAQIIYTYLNSANCKHLIVPKSWLSPTSTKLKKELRKMVSSSDNVEKM